MLIGPAVSYMQRVFKGLEAVMVYEPSRELNGET